MIRGYGRTCVIGAATLGLLAAAVVGAAPSGASPTVSTVISGLNAPRGVAFDGQGSLYVSEPPPDCLGS